MDVAQAEEPVVGYVPYIELLSSVDSSPGVVPAESGRTLTAPGTLVFDPKEPAIEVSNVLDEHERPVLLLNFESVRVESVDDIFCWTHVVNYLEGGGMVVWKKRAENWLGPRFPPSPSQGPAD